MFSPRRRALWTLLAVAAAAVLLTWQDGRLVLRYGPQPSPPGAGEVTDGPSPSDVPVDLGPKQLTIVSPTDGASIAGNVLRIDVAVSGVRLVPPGQATEPDTAYLGVLLDEEPMAVGDTFPDAVTRSGSRTIHVFGVPPGRHRLQVVAGDENNERVYEELSVELEVEIAGPTIAIEVPGRIDPDEDLEDEVESTGLAPGARRFLIIDHDPLWPGSRVPAGIGFQEIDGSRVELADLEPGRHTLWVVVADAEGIVSVPHVTDVASVLVGTAEHPT